MAKKQEPSQAEKLKQAAALLQADRDQREREYLKELQALNEKYQCDLIPVMQVRAR